jgi:ABC-2 type transport system permease protein
VKVAAPNILKLIYRNLVVNTDPGTMIILVGLPGLYLVFFGFGFQSMSGLSGAGNSYLKFLAPGIVAFQTVIAGTVAGGMLWADRRWGMLAQMLVGPYSRLEYLLGIMLTSVAFGLIGTVVMIGVAYVLIGSLSLTAIGVLLMFSSIITGSILFGSMTLILAALVKSSNAYNSVSILLLFVINFASTVFYKLNSGLPLPIQWLFEVNPLTYVADTVRDGYANTISMADGWYMLSLLVGTAALLFIAVRSYMRSDISFV